MVEECLICGEKIEDETEMALHLGDDHSSWDLADYAYECCVKSGNKYDPKPRKRKRRYPAYLVRITFKKFTKHFSKIKRARLHYTTRVKKVPVKKSDIITLVFTSKTDYQKFKAIVK